MRIALIATLLALASCKRSEDEAARARMFSPQQPVGEMPEAKEKLDAARLAEDAKLARRVLHMSRREVEQRIGAYKAQQRVQFAWFRGPGLPDGGSEVSLAEETTLWEAPGEDFTALAKENSQVDASVRGNVLGPFLHGELSSEIETAVFAAKVGDVLDPLVVGDAVHVIRLESRDQSVAPPLASVREKIYDGLEARKFQTGLNDYLESLWRNSDIHVADDYVPRIPPEFRKYLK